LSAALRLPGRPFGFVARWGVIAVLAMIALTRCVFWGPMAVSIVGGLSVAAALTLLALPAMVAAWFRVRWSGLGHGGPVAG